LWGVVFGREIVLMDLFPTRKFLIEDDDGVVELMSQHDEMANIVH